MNNKEIKWKPRASLKVGKSGWKGGGTVRHDYYSPYHNEFACVYEYYSIRTLKLMKVLKPQRYIQL